MMPDTIERLSTCARQLLDAGAEIERLQAALESERQAHQVCVEMRNDAERTRERLR